MIEEQCLVWRKTALALAISSALFSSAGFAQDAPASPPNDAAEQEEKVLLEEVVIYGVRASQAKAIDIKREAANIVDSIVAEDIGKLPDTTITDSLQRITGVQIKREANEGTSLNVRGMPQVLTTLNGEQFLSPWTITGVGANYGDIPAGMISGVNVYKSTSADMVAGGISGVVDLLTFKPLDLEEGWTGKLKLQLSQGSLSDEELQSDGSTDTRNPDHDLALFMGHNFDGRFGFTAGLFTNVSNAANYQIYEDQRLAFLDEQNGTPSDPLDLDQDGDLVNDWYLVPQEFGARSNFMEREREGGSFSLQGEINAHFTARADIFYTRMDQYDRGVKAAFNGRHSRQAFIEEDRYQLANGDIVIIPDGQTIPEGATPIQSAQHDEEVYNVLQPGTIVGRGAPITYVDANGETQTRELHTLRVARITAADFQTKSTNEINRTAALNTNFQLNYDNLDNLEASVRYVHAEAEKHYRKAQLDQGNPAWNWIDSNGDGVKDPLNVYDVTIDYRGEIPSFSYDADLSDANLLEVYQGFGEGANTEASLDVLRLDGKFSFNSDAWYESVDFGTRYSVRDAKHSKFFYVTPTARYSNWDNPEVAESRRFRLRTGNAIWEKYPEWRRFDYQAEAAELRNENIGGLQDNGFNRDATIGFSDFGPIRGFEGGVSSLNPAAWDNPLDFLNRLYPGTRTAEDPGRSYEVEQEAYSIYSQLNFTNDEGLFGVPFSGNLGVRVVRTNRTVVQAEVPEVLNRFNSIGYDDWQRIAFVSTTRTIEHSYTDVLPSANINFYPTDDTVVRFGAAETTSRNDLLNVGAGLTLWYQRCPETHPETGERIFTTDSQGNQIPEEISCVGGGNDEGDPYIKPWRARVYNASAEWYFDENAILGGGIFLIDIEESVERFQEQRLFLDGDGLDRGHTANVWVTDNVGAADLYGLELGYKQPFTFLPGEYLSALGAEFNYTYSRSEGNDVDVEGDSFPLPSNSEHQTNFILWYDKDGLNARIAYNWRSREYLGRVGLNTNETPVSVGNWLEPTGYLDLSVSYWINDHVSVFANATNLTEQNRVSYSQFEEQFHSLWAQERRFALGVTLSL